MPASPRKRFPRSPIPSLALSLALVSVVVTSCGDVSGLLPGPQTPAQFPPATLRDVVFEGFSQVADDVVVRAERAEIDGATGRAHLHTVRIQFADAERGRVRVKAERAEVELDTDDFSLLGAVTGELGNGERFWTANVSYDREREMLSTDEPVRVERGPLVLEGNGMELELASRRLRFKHAVHGRTGAR